jgi:hypothetical protein
MTPTELSPEPFNSLWNYQRDAEAVTSGETIAPGSVGVPAPRRSGQQQICSIKLPKMLNQQFSKDPDLSCGVVPRRSDNEDPAFSERIAIH